MLQSQRTAAWPSSDTPAIAGSPTAHVLAVDDSAANLALLEQIFLRERYDSSCARATTCSRRVLLVEDDRFLGRACEVSLVHRGAAPAVLMRDVTRELARALVCLRSGLEPTGTPRGPDL